MSQIDYYCSAYSLYAYLGSKKFLEIEKKSERSINHRPVCLVTVMVDNGNHRWKERTEKNLHCFFRRQKTDGLNSAEFQLLKIGHQTIASQNNHLIP
ncbi:hypothetical protein N9M78_05275 [Alphaproteobacteria bacterium]|nr:hypothetical protein [Alphaproteobacteria bacterium]